MTAETFFANFGHLADAPNGVKKLRELILQLAVQGKLVPQDVNDEPANILVERIRECTAITASRGRKTGDIEDFDSSKYPYTLPKNWAIAPFGEIAQVIRGITFPASEKSKTKLGPKVACLRTANVQSEIDWIDLLYIDSKYVKNDDQWVQLGDVIISMANSYELVGKVSLVRNVKEKASFGGFIGAIRSFGMNASFLHLFLSSPYMQIAMRGTASQTTNIANISLKGIRPIPIGVPPLAEQKRIVAKVDQLMALCDELETRQKKQQQGRLRLNNAALDALLTASKPDELADHWQRISTNFDLLYDHPENIVKLRATILQLAVQGKLVPQDPNDEPAEFLLERLRADRKAWLEANATGNPECRTAINKLEKLKKPGLPFRIPDTWQFAKLIDCCELLVDCHNKTAPYAGFGIPIIRTTNVRDRAFKMVNLKYVSEETYQFWSRRCAPKPADIIFTREAPMGEAAIIPDGKKYCLGQRTMLIRPMHDYMMNSYLLITLTEPNLLERTSHNAIGSTVKHFRVGDVESFDIAVPPLEEQKRIVAKVDQLMALCDELETKLTQAQQRSEKLMEATVRQLLVA